MQRPVIRSHPVGVVRHPTRNSDLAEAAGIFSTAASKRVLMAAVALLIPSFTLAAEAGHRVIASKNAPPAIGPYSQAILANDTLYVAGQIALDSKTGEMAAADIAVQTRQVMANLSAVLEAAGMSMDDVVQTQVFLADLNDFAKMNEIYGTYFKTPPARVTLQAARLPRDARIEISLIAVKR